NTEDSGPRERPRKNAARYDAAAYEANYPGVRRDNRDDSFGPPARHDESLADSNYPPPVLERSYQPPQQSNYHPQDSYLPTQPPPRTEAYVDNYPRNNVASWSAQVPQIPPAPAVPRDVMAPNMPAGFVMGVQPIRGNKGTGPSRNGQAPVERFP